MERSKIHRTKRNLLRDLLRSRRPEFNAGPTMEESGRTSRSMLRRGFKNNIKHQATLKRPVMFGDKFNPWCNLKQVFE